MGVKIEHIHLMCFSLKIMLDGRKGLTGSVCRAARLFYNEGY